MTDDSSQKGSKPFYITTTLPYVNSEPHIGFAMEIIRADIIAQWKKLEGHDVFFNTGTDEHGMKIYQKAFDFGEDPQKYVDRAVVNFQSLGKTLGLSEDLHFIRTTSSNHIKAAQEFWRRCDKRGFIYKKKYKTKYCVSCELERTDSEIENGRCFLHQNIDLTVIEEENYFFKFSEFQKPLLELYEKNPKFVVPDFRFNEIKKFVERGLEDFSISRLKEKMPWGVPVPDDPSQVMYVWFDALINYISTLGWPENEANFNRFWKDGTPVQYCGKDNIRQQSAMWQAMLMAVGLPNSHTIVIDGFINSGGQKMSKSLGNVISPEALVKEFGVDALRYHVAREFSTFEDSDFTPEKFKESYNANLANGLGNLVSRVMKMAETNLTEPVSIPENTIPKNFIELINAFEMQKATNVIWEKIGELDRRIQTTEPFKLIKIEKEKALVVISELVIDLYTIGRMLNPILPETSAKIKKLVKENKSPETPLFARKD